MKNAITGAVTNKIIAAARKLYEQTSNGLKIAMEASINTTTSKIVTKTFFIYPLTINTTVVAIVRIPLQTKSSVS